MTDLNGKKRLSEEQIKDYLSTLKDNWEVIGEADGGVPKLVKEIEFKNFNEAVSFVNKVAVVANELDHHPNIYLHDFKKVKLELWTHQLSGLHEKDFVLASKIDAI